MQDTANNSDVTPMSPRLDSTVFDEVELIVADGSSELDAEIDKAIGVVQGLKMALLCPGDAIRRAALSAADDWLAQFQFPVDL